MTADGRKMEKVSQLLEDAIMSIIEKKDEGDIDSFFGSGETTFLDKGFSGLDDFELIAGRNHGRIYRADSPGQR